MKNNCVKIVMVFLIMAGNEGCYYDNEENLYPTLNSACDVSGVLFSFSVKPMLNSYCLTCHSNSTAAASGGSIKLENYSDVKTLAGNNKLYGSVTHMAGISPMPKGGTRLDDCTLLKLKKWIDDGALNN